MIAVSLEAAYFEALDGRDTRGRMLIIQLGPLVFSFHVGWGRK